jgi:hypothetical protein
MPQPLIPFGRYNIPVKEFNDAIHLRILRENHALACNLSCGLRVGNPESQGEGGEREDDIGFEHAEGAVVVPNRPSRRKYTLYFPTPCQCMLMSAENGTRCGILDPRSGPASRKPPQQWQEESMGQIPNGLVAGDGNDNVWDTTRSCLLAVPEKPEDERGHSNAREQEDAPDRFHAWWSCDAIARLRVCLRRPLENAKGHACLKRSFGEPTPRLRFEVEQRCGVD